MQLTRRQFLAYSGVTSTTAFSSTAFAQSALSPFHTVQTEHGTWVNFIKTGKPQHKRLPNWLPYTLKTRETMIFNSKKITLEKDPYRTERVLWNTVL